MAITVSLVDMTRLRSEKSSSGSLVMVHLLLTMDDSYPTGGETLDLSAYFVKLLSVNFSGDSLGVVLNYDPSSNTVWNPETGKVKAYYADYDAVGDGVLIEVADTTDLSTVIVRVKAIGYSKTS